MDGRLCAVSPSAEALREYQGLTEVNEALARYKAWHELMDAWVVVGVDDPAVVYQWRLQAERAMAASGRPGMSDAQVADFVSRYMPAYHAYLPALYAAAEAGGVDAKPTIFAKVDAERRPSHPDRGWAVWPPRAVAHRERYPSISATPPLLPSLTRVRRRATRSTGAVSRQMRPTYVA